MRESSKRRKIYIKLFLVSHGLGLLVGIIALALLGVRDFGGVDALSDTPNDIAKVSAGILIASVVLIFAASQN